MIVDERTLKDKVYNIRGTLVMLDFELAELYGYTTKAFNQQVKNNIKKFDADFRFKLSKEEWSNLKSKILTPSWGGRRTIPYAFTEQGIYMLMTVISDNKLKLLKLSEYNDFLTEYPKKTVDFIKSEKRAHDRYIIIDNGTTTMKVYHCGASSKDAGKRITSIMRVKDISNYKEMVKDLLTNPPLVLK